MTEAAAVQTAPSDDESDEHSSGSHAEAGTHEPATSDEETEVETSSLDAESPTPVHPDPAEDDTTDTEPTDAESDPDPAEDDGVEAAALLLCGTAEFSIVVESDQSVHVRCDGRDVVIVEPNTVPGPGGDDDDDDPIDTDPDEPEPSLCRPVTAIEHQKLPARAAAMSADVASAGPRTVLVSDLFERFSGWCGSCHVDFGLGGLHVDFATFSQFVTSDAIERMRSPDPAAVMPPGKLFSERAAGDPVVELYQLLKIWRSAADAAHTADPNSELKAFTLPAEEASTEISPYILSPEQGAALTNLGTCIPDPALVGSENEKSVALDTMFASAMQLPTSLRSTDLFTLDTSELARHGVVAYAPTYPLFSDDAGKLRMVRVPKGTSVQFDRATQSFSMPPNTRFYKTFFKRVKDTEGNLNRWRKIETRLIVSRPDRVLPNGTREPTALFGTYRWDEEEKEATLVVDPLRNGEPFRDTVFQYLTDEVQGKIERDRGSPDIENDLMRHGLARYYAMPSSARCVDCHRGGDSHAFILGFGPLQVNRLPMDENPNDDVEQHLHGIFEAPGPDELTQLQRFIDYGIISGIDEPSDESEVFPLELTQEVMPRNEHELTAQGYMVGNCAGCHNPDGLASFENPILRNVLDFYPDMDGGIFGFPLSGDDAFSPRIFRADGTKRIPYVSPDLRDRDSSAGTPTKTAGEDFILAPWRSLIYRNVDTPFTYVDDGALFPKMPLHAPGFDRRAREFMGQWMASIPARQLFNDDNTRNALEQTFEEVLPGEDDYEGAVEDAAERLVSYRSSTRFACLDVLCEEHPDQCAKACVDTRDIVDHRVMASLRTGSGDFSPALSPLGVPQRAHWVNTDLTEPPLDHWEPRRADWPDVLLAPGTLPTVPVPVPSASASTSAPVPSASASASTSAPVPSASASTSAPVPSASASGSSNTSAFIASAYAIENGGAGGASEFSEFSEFTAQAVASASASASTAPSVSASASSTTAPAASTTTPVPSSSQGGQGGAGSVPEPETQQSLAASLITELRVTDDFRELALGERPMTFWEPRPDCDLSEDLTPGTYFGNAPAAWLDAYRQDATKPEHDRPLYFQSPAELVFSTICANCHGPSADSKGRQAATVALMSGGATRVANLRDGLFGPGHIEIEFGPYADTLHTAEDRAVQYLAWMALGGTQRRIPKAVLELVRRTKVYGHSRLQRQAQLEATPNMLETAAHLCTEVLTMMGGARHFNPERGLIEGNQEFIEGTGDPEVWRDLCTYNNPPPLVVLGAGDSVLAWGTEGLTVQDYVKTATTDGYPLLEADWPIGNQRGETVEGLRADNSAPWCVLYPKPGTPKFAEAELFAAQWEDEHQAEFPVCPEYIQRHDFLTGGQHPFAWRDHERWGLRGAANVGMAVFVYLKAISEGLQPRPAYNRCDQR